MKLHRIYGLLLRYLLLSRRSLDKITDSFYWPVIDLLLWGLTGYYFSSLSPNAPLAVNLIVSAIIFWFIVIRGQYEISINLLEEVWNKNLVNLFVSPLKLSEWICSLVILGIIKAALSFTFGSILALVLYKVNIFVHGFKLIPLGLLLILSGWALGFFISGIILRFGTKVQNFSWTMVWIISPFSAIYFPLSILPQWAQTIAHFIPTSYVFESAREIITSGYLDPQKLIISFILNIIYLGLSLWFWFRSFSKVLERGLVKVS